MTSEERADRHRRIIGACFCVCGIFTLLFTAILPTGYVHILLVRVLGNVCGLLYLMCSYALYAKARWTHKIGMPAAVVSALNVPIGTALAIYYFWYHRTYVEPET
jgi:hypothetical protein